MNISTSFQPDTFSSMTKSNIASTLLNRGVGFQNQFKFFEELLGATEAKYPPYDLLSTAEDEYELRFAVAGFKKSDIDVALANGVLTITGSRETEDVDAYFHKGIATRNFTQTFPLAEFVEVTSAEMEDGILTIKLKRELPDELQPKKIKIK